MASTSKSGKPRKAPLLTRNGRTRLSPLNLTQLVALMEKTTLKKAKGKIRSRILVLEKRLKKVA